LGVHLNKREGKAKIEKLSQNKAFLEEIAKEKQEITL
jgi:hypothetical protein